MNRRVRFLTWDMGFHREHHVYPSAPFHRPPVFHQAIGKNLHVANGGGLEELRYLGDRKVKTYKPFSAT